MLSPIDAYGYGALAVAALVMTFAGFTKGAVGFALPMIAISGVGSVLPATAAVAALIAPSLATNTWQTFRDGPRAAFETLREFWILNAALLVMIALSAQLVAIMPERVLFLFLGAIVTLFAAVQLSGWRPPSPDGRRRPTEVVVGLTAGFSGGLAGVWGPPILLYLLALETPKVKQMRAQGVSFLVGSVVLWAAHLRSGVLDAQTTPLSLALVIPALVGMAFGLAVHDRLDQARFRRLTLIVLFLAGLNLLRRGLF